MNWQATQARANRSLVSGLEEAIKHLADDGLLTRLGDRVGVTRAAVRTDHLDPI